MAGSSASFDAPTTALIHIWAYDSLQSSREVEKEKCAAVVSDEPHSGHRMVAPQTAANGPNSEARLLSNSARETSQGSSLEPNGDSGLLVQRDGQCEAHTQVLNDASTEATDSIPAASELAADAVKTSPQAVGTRSSGDDSPTHQNDSSKPKEKNAYALSSRSLRFQVCHAALCSEMGVHFSPCGKFLVVCVACKVILHIINLFHAERRSTGTLPFTGCGPAKGTPLSEALCSSHEFSKGLTSLAFDKFLLGRWPHMTSDDVFQQILCVLQYAYHPLRHVQLFSSL